jgi:hypothetical protein
MWKPWPGDRVAGHAGDHLMAAKKPGTPMTGRADRPSTFAEALALEASYQVFLHHFGARDLSGLREMWAWGPFRHAPSRPLQVWVRVTQAERWLRIEARRARAAS